MEHLGYLPEVVILLSTAILIVTIFNHLNLSPVLGYLVAGAAIGQYGLEFVDSDNYHILAEFGVVFLLFAIGLELTFERLMSMRLHVFGFGTAQVAITAFAISMICLYFGLSVEASIIIGGGLALSSTAIVLKVLADNNARATQVGRLSLATLLLQDFIVVPLLVLVPLLSEPVDSGITTTLLSTLGKAALALFLILFLGRMLLRPLFNLIAQEKSNEIFIAATLLIVLGTSFITNYFGLSLALGAFVAGLLVAETKYQHKVEDTIMPFKDLLMGLFFMTVGMSIDLEMIYNNIGMITLTSLAIIFGKATIIALLSKVFGFPWGSSIHAGLTLSQGSEFAFILFGLASQVDIGILDPALAKNLLLVVTVTMALTPPLSLAGQWLNTWLGHKKSDDDDDDEAITFDDTSDLNRHVIVVGYGRTGSMVSKLLDAKHVNFICVESDIKRARTGREDGFPVYHADFSKADILDAARVKRATAVIVTIPEDVYLKKVIRSINKHCPDVPIVVRSIDLKNENTLKKIGATLIVPEKYESGLQLAGALLRAIGLSEFEISRLKNQFRAGNYKLAKEIETFEFDN